jgi:hypothetical protein
MSINRARNESFTVMASQAITGNGTVVTEQFINPGYRGIMLVFDVTVLNAPYDLDPQVQAKDENGDWNETIWQPLPVPAAAGHFAFLMYPGAVDGDFDGNAAHSLALPREFQVAVIGVGAGNAVFSMRGHYMV